LHENINQRNLRIKGEFSGFLRPVKIFFLVKAEKREAN